MPRCVPGWPAVIEAAARLVLAFGIHAGSRLERRDPRRSPAADRMSGSSLQNPGQRLARRDDEPHRWRKAGISLKPARASGDHGRTVIRLGCKVMAADNVLPLASAGSLLFQGGSGCRGIAKARSGCSGRKQRLQARCRLTSRHRIFGPRSDAWWQQAPLGQVAIDRADADSQTSQDLHPPRVKCRH